MRAANTKVCFQCSFFLNLCEYLSSGSISHAFISRKQCAAITNFLALYLQPLDITVRVSSENASVNKILNRTWLHHLTCRTFYLPYVRISGLQHSDNPMRLCHLFTVELMQWLPVMQLSSAFKYRPPHIRRRQTSHLYSCLKITYTSSTDGNYEKTYVHRPTL